ncbi:MAG TPA: hypothetical protein VGB44_11255 [Flavobacterium sp.]|jgi:hypothetical protein
MEKKLLKEQEEQIAFDIVKAILVKQVEEERIFRSNAKTYLGVLLDNNSHRTICRLYLHNKKKYIGTLCERKVETRTHINNLDEIAFFSRTLIDTVMKYEHLSR